MNDNFLYELRAAPPSAFAARLKARLDSHDIEARRKRRSIRWILFGAVLMGGLSIAFVSPTMRHAALTMIVRISGSAAEEGLDRSSPSTVRSVAAAAEVRERTTNVDGEIAVLQNVQRIESALPAVAPTAAPAVAAIDTSSSGGAGQPKIVTGGQNRALIRIGYVHGLKLLAENVSDELKSNLKDTDVEFVGGDVDLDSCFKPQTSTVDFIFSDRQLTGAKRIDCAGRARIIEMPFAYNAIAIIVHRENSWARALSTADPHALQSASLITWSQIRQEWPTLPITLFGTSLGRSELGLRFAAAIPLTALPHVLEETKDDESTMHAVEKSLGAIGYINFATLNAAMPERDGWPTVAAIINSKGEAIEPSVATIQAGSYELSRPIYLYVDSSRMRRVELDRALDYLYRGPSKAIERSHLIAVGEKQRQAGQTTLRESRFGPRH